ncbi:dihydroxyacetone kinase transcriptional activator DhaS [Clostridium tagluense]|uniref:dihydroxyacetone kinase transcriptional activator DhaS n=1 Tax=Clostridium TaxID=1485 RepID=UPI0013E92387|nr:MULTISPECIES: dihydroxyacetone kinase transcriptional activator DhaS [Clostridium]MBU3127338.1 dihydroxyacetone kinase transcriptional activator DhaS [Clostridium tagluense]MBW9155367.1 dihydroxyacetone kinase transcriptional activator DhaS [Clostridium tagluense]MBZ9621657.1 dihydroxyacetone kinase transcriptional activator DhaS [Clostridium sp. FP2]MCB2311188.1 dihydroxyacetone kinase transcriptional activator DhaS [Clostridium tagluense]MCB2315912.1 dihydroxyacetone kinase transcriptiona
MSGSQLTKKALALSIKKLMETIPLSKLSIQEIVDNCGINRQTFYYHFKDKFDLVNWIYYTEAIENIDNCKNYAHWTDGMYKTLVYFLSNKSFYINALNTPGQNAFDGYLFEKTYDLIMGVINDISSKIKVSDKDKNFIADFYTYAFVGITVQWIKNSMRESPKTVVGNLNEMIEGSMLSALTRYATYHKEI